MKAKEEPMYQATIPYFIYKNNEFWLQPTNMVLAWVQDKTDTITYQSDSNYFRVCFASIEDVTAFKLQFDHIFTGIKYCDNV